MYTVALNVSDVRRDSYFATTVQLARHPSESASYMACRLLAYCREYREGLEFTRGLSESDEPAIWARNLTGEIVSWVEIGKPSPTRVHRAMKRGCDVAVYVHRDPRDYIKELSAAEIFNVSALRLYSVPAELLSEIERHLDRRNTFEVSFVDNEVFGSLNGHDISGTIAPLTLGG